jgi:hypothetical protein
MVSSKVDMVTIRIRRLHFNADTLLRIADDPSAFDSRPTGSTPAWLEHHAAI